MIFESYYPLIAVLAAVVFIFTFIVRATMDEEYYYMLSVCMNSSGIRMRGKVIAVGSSEYDAVCNWYSKKPDCKDWFVVGVDKIIDTKLIAKNQVWKLRIVSADIGKSPSFTNSFSL